MRLYIDGQTAVHRMHPVLKLALMMALFVAAFRMDHPAAIAPLLLLALALAGWAGAAPSLWASRPLLIGIPGATFVIWCVFFEGGEPLVSGLPLSYEAIRFAAGMSLKLATFLVASLLYLATARVEELVVALRSLGAPARVSFVFGLSFRLVPLFLDSAQNVVSAQRARGMDFDRGSLLERLRRYGPVLVPVFTGALRRAEAMAIALESRGFGGPTTPTRRRRKVASGSDWAIGVALAGLVTFYWSAAARGWGVLGAP